MVEIFFDLILCYFISRDVYILLLYERVLQIIFLTFLFGYKKKIQSMFIFNIHIKPKY